MNVQIKCINCELNFQLTNDSVNHKEKYIVKKTGDILFLTTSICPHCNKKFIVQVDSPASINILNESKKIFSRLIAQKQRSGGVLKRQKDRYEKLHKRLGEERKRLNKEYEGIKVKNAITNEEMILDLRFALGHEIVS